MCVLCNSGGFYKNLQINLYKDMSLYEKVVFQKPFNTPTVDVQHQLLGGRDLCSLIIENEPKEVNLIFVYYECPFLCQEELLFSLPASI